MNQCHLMILCGVEKKSPRQYRILLLLCDVNEVFFWTLAGVAFKSFWYV